MKAKQTKQKKLFGLFIAAVLLLSVLPAVSAVTGEGTIPEERLKEIAEEGPSSPITGSIFNYVNEKVVEPLLLTFGLAPGEPFQPELGDLSLDSTELVKNPPSTSINWVDKSQSASLVDKGEPVLVNILPEEKWKQDVPECKFSQDDYEECKLDCGEPSPTVEYSTCFAQCSSKLLGSGEGIKECSEKKVQVTETWKKIGVEIEKLKKLCEKEPFNDKNKCSIPTGKVEEINTACSESPHEYKNTEYEASSTCKEEEKKKLVQEIITLSTEINELYAQYLNLINEIHILNGDPPTIEKFKPISFEESSYFDQEFKGTISTTPEAEEGVAPSEEDAQEVASAEGVPGEGVAEEITAEERERETRAVEQQGIIGKIWGGIKSVFGIGTEIGGETQIRETVPTGFEETPEDEGYTAPITAGPIGSDAPGQEPTLSSIINLKDIGEAPEPKKNATEGCDSSEGYSSTAKYIEECIEPCIEEGLWICDNLEKDKAEEIVKEISKEESEGIEDKLSDITKAIKDIGTETTAPTETVSGEDGEEVLTGEEETVDGEPTSIENLIEKDSKIIADDEMPSFVPEETKWNSPVVPAIGASLVGLAGILAYLIHALRAFDKK